MTYNVYPFHLVAFFPDQVAWFRVVPMGANQCQLETVFLVAPEVVRTLSESEKDLALLWFDMINREDIVVNVTQQRGLRSRHARPGRLNRLENANVQFADYICRMVATN